MHTAPDIADCIRQNLIQYFRDLNGETPCGVYEMVLLQVGLNRNTLRKKLLQHKLLD